jgi:NADPH2:quinone reductase
MDLMNSMHTVVGFWMERVLGRPELVGPTLEEILGWISSGDLELTIGARYPLEQAKEAHEALEGRQTTGKIILNP